MTEGKQAEPKEPIGHHQTNQHMHCGDCIGEERENGAERIFEKNKIMALQIAVKRRSEKERRKGKIHLFECRVPKNSKER